MIIIIISSSGAVLCWRLSRSSSKLSGEVANNLESLIHQIWCWSWSWSYFSSLSQCHNYCNFHLHHHCGQSSLEKWSTVSPALIWWFTLMIVFLMNENGNDDENNELKKCWSSVSLPSFPGWSLFPSKSPKARLSHRDIRTK